MIPSLHSVVSLVAAVWAENFAPESSALVVPVAVVAVRLQVPSELVAVAVLAVRLQVQSEAVVLVLAAGVAAVGVVLIAAAGVAAEPFVVVE